MATKKCGYCGREVDITKIEKNEVNCWNPSSGHECDYTEEVCPYCGYRSISISDTPNEFVL